MLAKAIRYWHQQVILATQIAMGRQQPTYHPNKKP